MVEVPHEFNQKARAWVLRLAKEYDQILFTYSLKLKRPVIRIEPLKSKWGSWEEDTRTITLSTFLIEAYPWEVVLEILKHEMAHQWVTDIGKSFDGHGPLFRKACEILGVADWAARAEAESLPQLGELTGPPPSENEIRLFSRVEKLLNLAQSDNEHEALLAMTRVQEMYRKYNLDRIEKQQKADWKYFYIKLKKKRIERYQSVIASILNDHFFVDVVHASLYDAEDLCEYRVLELIGTTENVRMAEYVYSFLENQLRFLWNQYAGSKIKRRASRNSFYLGVLSGFREKLASPSLKTGTAMVRLKDPEQEKYLKYRHPRLVGLGGGRRLHDSSAFSAGKTAGRSLILKRAIEDKPRISGRFLGFGKGKSS